MRRSTRYGLAGIGALALLSLVHWLRGRPVSGEPIPTYLLGVVPNLAAAIAITFVLLSIWADQNKDAPYSAARRWFLVFAALSACGLLAWEIVQRTSARFVFDPHDVGATLVGIGAAALIFLAITPSTTTTKDGGGD